MASEKRRLIDYKKATEIALDLLKGKITTVTAVQLVTRLKWATVDAAEVVHCKDCKHWAHMEEGFGDCTHPRFHLEGHVDPTTNWNDFCSCGERKDNGKE